MKVKHRVYGNGIVKHLDSDYIIIAFEDQEKKFQFPQAFEKFLTTEDSELISKIDDATKRMDTDNVMQNINQTGASTQAKRSASSTKQLSGYINLGSTNPLIGARAQGINICSEEEMFEIVGYMATPGRINSIEAEVPKDGRDTVFENLFPGQKYRPIEMGNTPSGLPNKLSISDDSDGIIVLEEDANKWGLELRLYLHHSPACIHATKNRAYRNDYEYRINDVDVIWELFEMGYRIGKN